MFINKMLIATIAVAMQTLSAVDLQQDEIEVIPDVDLNPKLVAWAAKALTPETRGYFMNETYQAKTKEEKLVELWGQINPDPNTVQSVQPYYWAEFPTIFTQSSGASYSTTSDEMRRDRLKVSHTQGVHAKISWEPAVDTPYTGMYATGSENAILRLSETTMLTDDSSGLMPSLAIKFLKDGTYSENIFGMPNFTGTDSWNFFKLPMRNRVEPFSEVDNSIEFQTIRKKLIEGTKRPYGTGVSGPAQNYDDGTEIAIELVNSPYEIVFTSPFQFSDEKEISADGEQVMYYDQLKRDINEGDVILEAWALTAPYVLGGELVKLADVRLLSPLVTSVFGDTRLFFQHDRICRDRNVWPREWRKLAEDDTFAQDPEEIWGREVPTGEFGWPEDAEAAKDKYVHQIAEYGCPFAWLLGMN